MIQGKADKDISEEQQGGERHYPVLQKVRGQEYEKWEEVKSGEMGKEREVTVLNPGRKSQSDFWGSGKEKVWRRVSWLMGEQEIRVCLRLKEIKNNRKIK